MNRRFRPAPTLGIALDATGPDPLHRQIWQQLRRAILERRLTPGTRLPSSRRLAVELGCARGTVLVALDQLVAEGYLVARAASGMCVTSDLPDEMLTTAPVQCTREGRAAEPDLPSRTRVLLADDAATKSAAAGALAFPIGQPDRAAFPFPLWAKLLEQDWRKPSWPVAAGSDAFGHPALRRAIATYLGAARGFACEPNSIVITTGVQHSVSLFARVVLERGDTAWTEEPGYLGIATGLAAACVRAVPVPIDAAGFSVEAATANAPAARLAVVAPAHQFPLGTVLSLQRRLALLSWAERTGGWIIEDDFDGEYRYSGRPLAPLRALDRSGRVAYLGSFSKLLFPALRLSYLVLPAALVLATERVMAECSVIAPLLGQGALARFIMEGELAAHLRRTRLLYAGRQSALLAAAKQYLAGRLEIAPDPGGMHLVARPVGDAAFDDIATAKAAAAACVQVAPLSPCYRRANKTHGLLLGYAATPEAEIEPAAKRLAAALDRR